MQHPAAHNPRRINRIRPRNSLHHLALILRRPQPAQIQRHHRRRRHLERRGKLHPKIRHNHRIILEHHRPTGRQPGQMGLHRHMVTVATQNAVIDTHKIRANHPGKQRRLGGPRSMRHHTDTQSSGVGVHQNRPNTSPRQPSTRPDTANTSYISPNRHCA